MAGIIDAGRYWQGGSALRQLAFVACAALFLGMSPRARATSFDCGKAATAVEQAICADDSLGALDDQVAERYADALADSSGKESVQLRSGQRAWIGQRNLCEKQAGRLNACLRESMQKRRDALVGIDHIAAAELDRYIADIPVDPAGAAQHLRTYTGGLASAWLVYLHRFEPASRVTPAEAQARRKMAMAALADDEYAQSVLKDVEKDPATSEDVKVLTVLRMQIERAPYDPGGERPYVHCFVFQRQGEAAYRAMGSLYGSTRDGRAPLCPPQGDLYEQPAWVQLNAAFRPLLRAASGNMGTIRYASYADWKVLALRSTVSPRDYLDPAVAAPVQGDLLEAVGEWKDDKSWPLASRKQAQAAIPAARLVTATWLHDHRGLTRTEADQAARVIVSTWVDERMGFAHEALDGEQPGDE